MSDLQCSCCPAAAALHTPLHTALQLPLPTAGRLYLRIAADLHMCLSHPAVVLALLLGPQSPLFSSHFLEVLRLIEGASPFK